ncbi:uncharacterized protein L201_003657 [Kwoniella dendrophila CBS 6074]|uniref:Uncharacterized protein n=1 Tax=Kwoniella dendrophila CBS 6074 TaxID=1295534 RepID=A0AAX4JV26_9TREE
MADIRAEIARWPHTASSMIDPLSREMPSTTHSPDSSYSATSPEFQSPTFSNGPAFEYDNSHEEINTEEYDEMREHIDSEENQTIHGQGEIWNRPGWGNLNNFTSASGSGRRPSWALSVGGGSVISISPRGSLASLRGSIAESRDSFSGSLDSRRGSSSLSKAYKLPYEVSNSKRRQSNPSLLGFDLSDERRRSSAKSLVTRRRSSGLSSNLHSNNHNDQHHRSNSFTNSNSRQNSRTSSIFFDSIEESRLRNIASLELLRRRFSEVVEVTIQDSSDEEEDLDDEEADRRAWAYQGWSPATTQTDDYYESDYDNDYDEEDDSELNTASYVPSPEFRNHSSLFQQPSTYSNFPLESVAIAPDVRINEDSLSESSSIIPSPLLQAPRFTQTSTANQIIGTPPPPAQPNAILRDKRRPSLNRATTNYVAPRSAGVPIGAAPPRPGLARSVSNPLISSTQSSKEVIKGLEIRAAGSFPVARSTPLGISPLRESMKRQSVVSEASADSRKNSLAERRRSSLAPGISSRRDTRNGSMASDISEASRRASLAERRMSLVKESALRRMSGDTRRSSKGGSNNKPNSRKSSEALLGSKDNSQPICGELRRPSSIRSSTMKDQSRQSSVVSIGEYGYLGPQIVIDVASKIATPEIEPTAILSVLPTQPSSSPFKNMPDITPKSTTTKVGQTEAHHRLRANAPASIVLPSYKFPQQTTDTLSPTTAGLSTATPRFNSLSYFINNDPSPTSSSPYDSMVTPTASKSFFPSPFSTSTSTLASSPKIVNVNNNGSSSILDRGRPIASPEFDSSQTLPFKSYQPPSPKSPGAKIPLSTSSMTIKEKETTKDASTELSNQETSSSLSKSVEKIIKLQEGVQQKYRKTISIEDMHLVLANANAKEKSVELGDTDKSLNDIMEETKFVNSRPGFIRQATIAVGAQMRSTEKEKDRIFRPNLLRGISVPVLSNQDKPQSNYIFPSTTPSQSASQPSSPYNHNNNHNQNRPRKDSSTLYQFPQQSPTASSFSTSSSGSGSDKGKGKSTLQLPDNGKERPVLKQRRSITFVEPPSPRSSNSSSSLSLSASLLNFKPKMDRTSSFTKFFHSKKKTNTNIQ